MAHALGGVLAMLFWAYLRRNVPDPINKLLICLIAFAVIMMVLAVTARAEDAQQVAPTATAAEISLLKARIRHVEEKVARGERAVRKAYMEVKRCGAHLDANLGDSFCRKLHDRSVTAKHCGILLGWTTHDPEQKVPWSQQRQELCEHLVNSGKWRKLDDKGQEKLLRYLIKHAK